MRQCILFALFCSLVSSLAFAGKTEGEVTHDDFYDITQDPSVVQPGEIASYVPVASMAKGHNAIGNTLRSLAQCKRFSRKVLDEAIAYMREQAARGSVFYGGLTAHFQGLWYSLFGMFRSSLDQAFLPLGQQKVFFQFYSETLRRDFKKDFLPALEKALAELNRLKEGAQTLEGADDFIERIDVWIADLELARVQVNAALAQRSWGQVRALLGVFQQVNATLLAYAENVPQWPSIDSLLRYGHTDEAQQALEDEALILEAFEVGVNHGGEWADEENVHLDDDSDGAVLNSDLLRIMQDLVEGQGIGLNGLRMSPVYGAFFGLPYGCGQP